MIIPVPHVSGTVSLITKVWLIAHALALLFMSAQLAVVGTLISSFNF